MGGTQSTQQQPPKQPDMSVLVDKMITDPSVPTSELLKVRDAVFMQKSSINKSQEQALRVVLNSINKTQKAENDYKKLNKAIRNRTNTARTRVSGTRNA